MTDGGASQGVGNDGRKEAFAMTKLLTLAKRQ